MAPLNAPFRDTLADREIKYSEMNRVYEFKPIDGVESVLPYLREGVRINLDPGSGLPVQLPGLSICCLVCTENPRRRCYMANAVNDDGELIFDLDVCHNACRDCNEYMPYVFLDRYSKFLHDPEPFICNNITTPQLSQAIRDSGIEERPLHHVWCIFHMLRVFVCNCFDDLNDE